MAPEAPWLDLPGARSVPSASGETHVHTFECVPSVGKPCPELAAGENTQQCLLVELRPVGGALGNSLTFERPMAYRRDIQFVAPGTIARRRIARPTIARGPLEDACPKRLHVPGRLSKSLRRSRASAALAAEPGTTSWVFGTSRSRSTIETRGPRLTGEAGRRFLPETRSTQGATATRSANKKIKALGAKRSDAASEARQSRASERQRARSASSHHLARCQDL